MSLVWLILFSAEINARNDTDIVSESNSILSLDFKIKDFASKFILGLKLLCLKACLEPHQTSMLEPFLQK